MTDKQIYEMDINDLACFGVWYFPVDESEYAMSQLLNGCDGERVAITA